jgi:hypothetical protein
MYQYIAYENHDCRVIVAIRPPRDNRSNKLDNLARVCFSPVHETELREVFECVRCLALEFLACSEQAPNAPKKHRNKVQTEKSKDTSKSQWLTKLLRSTAEPKSTDW